MSAIISPCGLYRYRLERDLGGLVAGPSIAWVMVNPSTADANTDDATIRKVIGFSRRLCAGRVVVGNLFAFRATDIRALRTAADPIGGQNDEHLSRIMCGADIHIVAWGPLSKLPISLRQRWLRIEKMAGFFGQTLQCLGTAQDGHPLHPLMLGYDRPLVPWSPPDIRKEVSGQSVSLSPLQGQTENAEATGIERPTPTPGGLAEGERS